MKTFLVKVKVEKDGRIYWDIYLAWRVNEKLMSVRVAPQFSRDYRFLVAHALQIESFDNLEKYV